MIALAFFAGIFLTAAVAILIVRGAKAPGGYQPLPSTKFPPPPMPRVKTAIKPCIACYGGDFPCVCQRDADFWDIANHEPDAGRVEYRFLGITGFEDD